MPEFPVGAIHNGRVLIERLETWYDFECEAGPLRGCVEWDDLKRCFEALAEFATKLEPVDADQPAGEM